MNLADLSIAEQKKWTIPGSPVRGADLKEREREQLTVCLIENGIFFEIKNELQEKIRTSGEQVNNKNGVLGTGLETEIKNRF